MTRAILVSICFSSLLVVGCFDAPKPACAFLCGDDNACPDGYACAGDGWCKRDGVDPSFMCDDVVLPPIDADTTPDAIAVADASVVDAAAIDAGLALGSTCTTGDQCNSGNCADLVCCNETCLGSCEACSTAAGATTNGTCDLLGSSVVCRASAGECDVAESCTGAVVNCPVDGFASPGSSCGSATDDDCTNPDTCNSTGTCLANHEVATTPCTDTDATDCDDAQCDGGGGCAQAGGIELSSHVCRVSVDSCDLADNCGGTVGGACPSDVLVADGTQGSPTCAPYVCDGSMTSCPVTCALNEDCDTGKVCDEANGCVNPLGTGFACSRNDQCASGTCDIGVSDLCT